jgi:hypothetical protein
MLLEQLEKNLAQALNARIYDGGYVGQCRTAITQQLVSMVRSAHNFADRTEAMQKLEAHVGKENAARLVHS